jgi:hypothetical protein
MSFDINNAAGAYAACGGRRDPRPDLNCYSRHKQISLSAAAR